MYEPTIISGPDVYSTWVMLLGNLLRSNSRPQPRAQETRELCGVTLRVDNALKNVLMHPVRDLNYKFMVAEWLWIMSGSGDLELIAKYNSKLREFSDDGLVLSGAYGPRLKDQLPWVLERLNAPDTRQAVATVWTPCPLPSKDVPCTVALQFLLRGDLNLIVTMRSSDAWLGLPYDFFVFSQILNCVAGVKNVKPGWVQFNLGSSHLYERDVEKATHVTFSETSGHFLLSYAFPGFPPNKMYDLLRYPELAPSGLAYSNYWLRYAQILALPKAEAYGKLI